MYGRQNTVAYRVCTKCGECKPTYEYGRSSGSLRQRCKACTNEDQRMHYAKSKQRQRQRQRQQ